jgi:PKD repeat protein
VNLQPQTVNLTFASVTSGLQLVVDSASQTTPFTVQVIKGSAHTISAPATQTLGGNTYTFASWSDAGDATHNVTASAATSYTATYTGGGGGTNNPPIAVATGAPTSGTAPLAVNFDGSGSSDPDAGDTIAYSWDLDGNGTFGDSTVQKPSFTYVSAGTYNAVLKVTDSHGSSTTSAPVTITVTAPSTFGTTTPGSLVDNMDLNYKEVSKFTAPAAGNVVKVSGYLSGLGVASGTEKVKAVIYADSGGNPGARLGVSNEVTITAGRAWGWVDFTFSSPVAIQAGPLWLGYIGGGNKNGLIQMRYDQLSGDLRYNKNTYSNNASNPFGSSSAGDFHYSIYATYG